MKFTFQPLTMKDLSHLHHWFQEPIIRQFYARNTVWSLDDIKQKYQPRIIGAENIPSFIIEINNQPSGFIQYYCLQEHPHPEGIEGDTNPLFKKYLPNEMAGIDVFIADDENRSKGLGVQIINQFIATFLMGYQLIVVDPERNNLQAIRCYEKSGFKKTDFSSDEHYLLLMRETKQRHQYDL